MAQRNGVLIIQPLPGIGDMIWHLPLIHAIANSVRERRVSILTKPRSCADSMLAADPAVERVLWLARNPGRHDGLAGLWRLAVMLRLEGFRQVWILHDSIRYALVGALAQIPERFGYGFGLQRLFLSRRKALSVDATAHPIEKAGALQSAHNLASAETEPRLVVAQSARTAVRRRWGAVPGPWLALGIGSSEPAKRWAPERFAALAVESALRPFGGIFLVGGPEDRALAENIKHRVSEGNVHVEIAASQGIEETAALLEACECYLGNDTGVLNLAAAVATPAIGLFGASAPLQHSALIDTVVPEVQRQGMSGISVARALEALRRRIT